MNSFDNSIRRKRGSSGSGLLKPKQTGTIGATTLNADHPEEFIQGSGLEMVEEKEDEEVLDSCRMTIMDINFQVCSIGIKQDHRSRSNTIISTYNLAENRARLTVKNKGIWLEK